MTQRLALVSPVVLTGDSEMGFLTRISTVSSLSTRQSCCATQARNLAASCSGGLSKLISTHSLSGMFTLLYNQDYIPTLSLYKWYCEEGQRRSNDMGTDEGESARSGQTCC